jgi:transmembrane sensor
MEGHVAVTSRNPSESPVEMQPRQELRLPDTGKGTLRDDVDPLQALAWREGKLVFDNEPLERVVARMNNYGATPIAAEGPAAQLRISGVFKAGDTAAFVDAMRSYFGLTALRREDAITLHAD